MRFCHIVLFPFNVLTRFFHVEFFPECGWSQNTISLICKCQLYIHFIFWWRHICFRPPFLLFPRGLFLIIYNSRFIFNLLRMHVCEVSEFTTHDFICRKMRETVALKQLCYILPLLYSALTKTTKHLFLSSKTSDHYQVRT